MIDEKKKHLPRVLHVVGRMDRGGAESRIMDIYRNIDRNRVQFDFLVYAHDYQDYEKEIEKLGGRLLYLRPVRESGVMQFMIDLVKLVNTHGPFIAIHAHTSYNSALALFAAKIAGIKIRIYHARNSKCISSVVSFKEKAYIIAMKIITSFCCNVRIAVGEKAAVAHFGKRRLKNGDVNIIPNAVDIHSFNPDIDMASVNRIKSELRIPEGSVVVGHIGNFRPEKNHVFLFRIFEDYSKLVQNTVLLLIGDDSTHDAISVKESIKGYSAHERILFIGKRDDVNVLLSAFDIMLFPSIREGIPGATLEAQAAGVPCIISDEVDHSVDMALGLVKWLPIKDPSVWANEIPLSIKNRIIDREKISKAFNQHNYTVQNAIAAMHSIYHLDKDMDESL